MFRGVLLAIRNYNIGVDDDDDDGDDDDENKEGGGNFLSTWWIGCFSVRGRERCS